MALTLAKVEKIAEKLKKLPDPPATERETSKQEAIRLLKKEIVGLQRRGYTVEQIVRSLKGEGLELSAATLKSYLSRAKGPSGGRRAGTIAAPARTPPRKKDPPKRAPGAKVASERKDEAPKRSGKDAFLTHDRKEY